MNRRQFLHALSPLLMLGSTVGFDWLQHGETASYALFNPSHVNTYQMALLVAEKDLLDEWLDVPALPPGAPGWSGGGPLRWGFDGHRVPHYVRVSWRLLPRSGQQDYKGDMVGPFQIPVRSQIPPEALHTATQRGHIVEIAVSVGVLPVRLRWRLIGPRSDGRGHREISRGGDWRLPAPGE